MIPQTCQPVKKKFPIFFLFLLVFETGVDLDNIDWAVYPTKERFRSEKNVAVHKAAKNAA